MRNKTGILILSVLITVLSIYQLSFTYVGKLQKHKIAAFGEEQVKIEKEITNKEQKLYLYCGGGSRSALATLNLQKMGYKNAVSVSGGFREWLNLSSKAING